MGTLETNPKQQVAVPRELLAEAIKALRIGGDAILDRDWDCYAASERAETEHYASTTLTSVAKQLEQLLDA